MTILVLMLALWATLVWAARLLLQESFLHFGLVMVQGVVLLYVFAIVCSNFRALRNEFDSSFYFLEELIFATTPLISSAVLTWFLCVEIPTLDLPICFSTIYFLYLVVLGKPRLSSHPNIASGLISDGGSDGAVMGGVLSSTSPIKKETGYIFSYSVIRTVYLVPIIISPILHNAVHINVMSILNTSRMTAFFASFLFPLLYMIICAEHQIAYWPPGASVFNSFQSPASSKSTLSSSSFSTSSHFLLTSSLGTLKLIVASVLFLCLQDHPFFDDIKVLSGLPEPFASATLCGVAILLTFAVYLYRSGYHTQFIENTKMQHGFTNIFVTLCIAAASLLAGLLINVPTVTLVNCLTGAASVTELYLISSWWSRGTIYDTMLYIFLVVVAAFSATCVALSFTLRTVMFLDFDFTWHFGTYSIQQYCILFAICTAVATVTPAFLLGTLAKNARSQGLLPSGSGSGGGMGGGSGGNNLVTTLSSYAFSLLFQSCAFVFGALELMMREQDWADYDITVGDVYPTYLFAITSMVFVLAAFHGYYIGLVGSTTAYVVILVQSCKLLHLVGVPSMGIAAATSILMNYTLPFILHCSDVFVANQIDEFASLGTTTHSSTPAVWQPNVSILQIIFYAISAAFSTYWAHTHVAFAAMVAVMQQDPTETQLTAASLCIYFLFLSAICLVFYRRASSLRSMFFVMAIISALIASEAIHPPILSINWNNDPSHFFSVEMLPEVASDHSGVFLIISVLLLMSAAFNVVAVKKPMSRLLFITLFSYCAAKAMMTWAFPISISIDSPHHNTFSLPWMYCIASTLVGTSAAIHTSLPSASSTGIGIFMTSATIPLLAVLWSVFSETLHIYNIGIVMVAAAVNAAIAISTRISEVSREIDMVKKDASSTSSSVKMTESFSTSTSICVMATLLSIMWTSLFSLSSPHVENDYAIPLACMLLLCTRRGILVSDTHPIALTALAAASWWFFSAIYAILLKGVFESIDPMADVFETPKIGLFSDADVSFWTAPSIWLPAINLVLTLVPLPAIIFSFLRRKEDSEDVLFVLAILSSVPVIGAQSTPVRFLGLVGAIYAAWKCYDIGQVNQKSNRLI